MWENEGRGKEESISSFVSVVQVESDTGRYVFVGAIGGGGRGGGEGRSAYSLRTFPDLSLATNSLMALSLRYELTSLVKVPSAWRFSSALRTQRFRIQESFCWKCSAGLRVNSLEKKYIKEKPIQKVYRQVQDTRRKARCLNSCTMLTIL